MVEWLAKPERRRQPTLPATNEGKINVRELTLALGLQRSQEQHFFNHAELRTLYCLVPVLDWPKVDAIGIKLLAEAGVETPSRDPRRLVGACDVIVKLHIRDGHTAGA